MRHSILCAIGIITFGFVVPNNQLLSLSAQVGPTDTLDIYWIDVEGGAATLIITPAQESILMDAGWALSKISLTVRRPGARISRLRRVNDVP